MNYSCSVVVLICCLTIICYTVNVASRSTENESKNSSLQLLHLMIRHGPRTPVNTYPNDPYVNETFYPYGWGHLTNDAKRELFSIGKWLRKRYRSFLGPYYQSEILHAQSTESPRTLMSLATVLASMFPPNKTPMEWNERFNWQPIPIFSEPEEKDIYLRMKAKCPRYEEALEEVLQRPEVIDEWMQYESLFSNLTEITGQNVTKADDVNSVFITLLAEKGYGLVLPEWTSEYFPEKMQFMAEQTYVYNIYTDEMKRIKGGPFLQKMFGQMKDKASGQLTPQERKIFFYCAHDWSITNILSALNVWQRQMPNFSALIAFELHKNEVTNEYYVEIYFKNDPKAEPKKLTVPGCDFKCPLHKLIELSDSSLPDGSYEQMCYPKRA